MHQLPLDGASMHAVGQLVFHGPREEIVGFFSALNMKVPERKAVPDFLQEVTSVKDQKVRFVLPRCEGCVQPVPALVGMLSGRSEGLLILDSSFEAP